jgi:integrase
MPRRQGDQLPRMTLHRASGRAKVRLCRIDVYLGAWGSDEAADEYDRIINLFLENGRRWPPPVRPAGTVAELGDRFLQHAEEYYRKRGEQTTSVGNIRTALELLYRSGAGEAGSGDPRLFGPRALKAFQSWLAGDPHQRWARPTINRYTGIVVQMFRWAAEEELLDASVWHALRSVRTLRKGRAVAGGAVPREGRRVRAVAADVVDATLARAPAMVAAMIRLQLLTGMRPGEVVTLRRDQLEPSADPRVWVYTVPEGVYKLDHLADAEDHRGRLRYLGPRAVEILTPWLPDDPHAYVFDPRRSESLRNAARREARRTPRWASHDPEHRRRARGLERRTFGRCYSVNSYRRAIWRACDKAFPAPEDLAGEELRAWRKAHRWSPNQLRHARATLIANEEKLHDAAGALGHTRLATTMRYITPEDPRQVEVALRHG